MRRSLQRLQAVAAGGWITETESSRPRQYVVIGTFFLTFWVLFAPLEAREPKGCLVALVFVPALWFVAYRAIAFLDGRASRQSFRQTDDLIESIRVSAAVRCASCRGFATRLVFDDDSPPCPWCGGPLTPSADSFEEKGAAVQREIAAQQEATRAALRRRARESSSPDTGGQRVFLGARRFRDANVWRASSGLDATMAERYEVDRSTALGRCLFFVREDTEPAFRELAESWRVRLPDERVDVVETALHQWRVYSDEPGELPRGEGLALVPYDLDEDQCLLVDRAGASHWVLGAHLDTPEERYREVLEWLDRIPGED
ncbi:MAG: hypothetical protein AAGA81_14075 [Acidobacteriota bacterium]